MVDLIDQFVEDISNEKPIENTVNPYADNWEYSKYARHNFKIYLTNISMNNSKVLFLGEAPGYKGCRLSGIPFTSERILVSESSNLIVGNKFDYRVRNAEKPQTERSATIIWNGLEQYDIYPLMWNAFPFHPYKPGNLESNRTPKKEELLIGEKYIRRLMDIFETKKVYAIGNIAYSTLGKLKLGVSVDKIRHPSMGGKKQFLEGLEMIKKV